MKAYELRATTDLAPLWGSRAAERRHAKLLAALYGWFTEGFDIANLKNAPILLAELS
jgi:hypothetical protein